MGELYAWMKYYGKLLHKITPGIYIDIKVEYTLFAQNKQQQHQQQQQQQQQQKY